MRELDNLPETGETGAAGSERDNIRHLPPGQCPGSVKLKTLATRPVSRQCQAQDTYHQVSVQAVSSSRQLLGQCPGGVKL